MEYLQANKTLQYSDSHILFLDKIILCKQLPICRKKINQEKYDTKYATVRGSTEPYCILLCASGTC